METATRARREFATWLAVDLGAGDLFDDLVLAVYEVVANCVDHAYHPTGSGPVALSARRSVGAVHITVIDQGTWRHPDPRTASARRGRGLQLIRRLVPDVHVEVTAAGTTVHLRAPVPPGGGR